MKTTLHTLLVLGIAGASSAFGQVTYSYDFGTGTGSHSSGASTTFLPSPATGGGTARVRIGTGGGSFALENPGNVSLGTGSELTFTASTNTSVNKFSIYDYEGAAAQVAVKFDMVLTGGSAGTIYFFVGDGASFSDNSGFTGAQVFTGIRWSFGASDSITTSVRTGSTWTSSGITEAPFAQNVVYSVELYGNNGTEALTYHKGGTQSIAASTFDLWINGILVGDNVGKGQMSSGSLIDSLMFYGESSAGNAASIRLDNLSYGSAMPVPEPSAFAAVAGFSVLGGAALRRKRRPALAG